MKSKFTLLFLLIILFSATPAWAGLTQNQISELYVSIFNRASEGGGNAYWRSQPDMAAAATAMLATQAAQNYFGTSLNSNQAFIEHIYLNTLNKEYWDDPIGITYWVNSLDNGKTRGEVVAELVGVIGDYAPGGPYYDPNEAATVIAYNQFTNRVAVSSYMADVVDTPPAGWETITQLGAVGLNVTDDENSVNLAKQFIDNLTSDDNNNDKPVITVGESEDIATQDIPPTGDIIVINQPGNPLHGMEIIVPPGAYADTRQFQVSSAPVLSHTFGELFEPLTPMITVENGGDHSEETMTVQIPVQVPQGWFAAAFFFDKDQGKLEPMQLISTEDDVVTVNTRHFSDFVVTGIPQSILENYLIEGIRSDFYPGVDDFSFANRGSYIAPGGHCAGQAIGAMWYYSAKPEGDQPLWGLYDNNFSDWFTPDFWEDDSYAYRFCSVLQKDMDWDSFAVTFWRAAQGRVLQLIDNQWQWVDVPGIGPESTRNLFALSMLLTGEPQYVGIRSNAGGGHAMIVYAVTRDALHIADPNYPGDINRTIYYSNGAFDPYPSGDNWDEINAGRGKLFETIHYLAKSTLMPWDNIAGRWQEVKNGTIGNDLFPGYEIKYLNEDTGEYELLGENQVFTENKVQLSLSGQSGRSWGWYVYRDQAVLSRNGDNKYELIPGNNLLGFDIAAKVGDDWEYIDFQYINVVYSQELTLVETYHNPHSDNPKLIKERYWVDAKEIKQGFYESFHRNGTLDRKGNYRNDLREGVWEERWDNGKLASEGSYTAGSRQGVWKFYYSEGGELSSTGSFKDDKRDGLWESWFWDGVKEEDQRYKEGVKHGLWTRYHTYSTSDNLIKAVEGYYEHGEKTGTWTYWNNLGEVINTEVY